MDVKINDYYEPDHFKALNEAIMMFLILANMNKMKCTIFMNLQRFFL